MGVALAVVAVGLVALGVRRSLGPRVPICALQDCTTKQIIDDGCSKTWFILDEQCLACATMCRNEPRDRSDERLPRLRDGGGRGAVDQ
jgi:hypothetical protein